uniref:Uncharacterized protein n=1 Tax=Anguilla anguilla TaxID=7936 RepID=A0A0E9UKZ6_ANGAN
MKPVTSQNTRGSSSNEDSRFIPKATPIRPKRETEKVPLVSCKFSRNITFRWLNGKCHRGVKTLFHNDYGH